MLLSSAVVPWVAGASEISDDVEVASAANAYDLEGVDLFERLTQLAPRISLLQAFVIDSDFGKSEVDTFISELRASVGIPITKKLGIRLSNVVEAEYFDFDNRNELIYTGQSSGAPFDPLISHRTRIDARYMLAQTWLIGGGAFFQSRVEDGASYGSGITGGVGLVFGKELWGQLSLLLGVGVSSRLDQSSPGISPIFQVRWKVNDDTEIRSEGLGARVLHRVSPTLKLDVSARFEGHRYRLDKRNGLVDPDDPTSGTVGKGSLRDRRFHVSTGATWAFAERWRLRGAVGVVAYHQYTSADHNGKKVDSTTANGPAFGCAFEVRYRF
jgi:outer membrane receptor protein involved in Fe transport